MTYQELIKCYPWIDLAWEVFKGVSPTVIALVTIFLTEHFIRKRNDIYKKREIELQYLEKILLWIHEIERGIFETQDAFSKVLGMKDIIKRSDKYNMLMKNIVETNKSVFVWCDTYDDIAKCFGCNLMLNQFRDAVISYTEQIGELSRVYLNKLDTKNAFDELNRVMSVLKEKMYVSTSILVSNIYVRYGSKDYNSNKVSSFGKKRQKFGMKKGRYMPYFFDEKYERRTYKHIGRDYGDSTTANKGWTRNITRWYRKHIYNRKESKYKICNTYEDWEIYVKSKLPMRTDYRNYMHWLIEQR